jgi:hypothetical protein
MGQIVEYNGARIEFPDGMPPAEIEAAIRKNALSLPSKAAAQVENDAISQGARNFAINDVSDWDRLAAGAGKAVADLGRGLGQYIPNIRDGELSTLVTRGNVAESRQLDAPLMNTTGGRVGNLASNLAMLAPTAFIPGANTLTGAAVIGGVTGALQPSTSTQETLTNTALGGIAAPATIMAVRGGQALYQGAKGLVEPLTKAGQERIAADVIRRTATDPVRAAQTAAQPREMVPGSQPTLAQAAQDPGLAQLERTILNNPEYAPALQNRFANQKSARLNAIKDIAGRGDHYDEINAGRALFANEDYGNAMAQGVDQKMAEALAPQIESLMRRPSIQAAKADAMRLARESDKVISFGGAPTAEAAAAPAGQTWKDFTAGKMGEYMRFEGGHAGAMKRLGEEWSALKNGAAPAAEAAPAQPMSLEAMDWLKKALDNQISKAAKPGSSIGDAELRALVQTKNDLMSTIEQIAPAYKSANDNYAAMSKQINSMDVARELLGKLQKPGSEYMVGGTGREMGDAYAGALSKSFDSVKKATGMNRGIEQVMNPQDIAALQSVARDIGRKSFSDNAGKAVGSPTAQNLASQNMLRRILGPTGLPQTWAESTMLQSFLAPVQAASRFSGADKRIMDRITMGLLDPTDGVGLLTMPPPVQSLGLLGAPSTQNLLPAVGLLGVTTRDRR